MNKADLMAYNLPEEVVVAILKQHNAEVNAVRKEVKELVPYRDAVHGFHIGYDPNNEHNIPKPESPEKALAQILTSLQDQTKTHVEMLMGEHVKAMTLLKAWDNYSVLAKEDFDKLVSNTKLFLNAAPAGAEELEVAHECTEECNHG